MQVDGAPKFNKPSMHQSLKISNHVQRKHSIRACISYAITFLSNFHSLSFCLSSIYLSICLSVALSFLFPFLCLSVHVVVRSVSVSMSFYCPYVCLYIFLFLFISFSLSACHVEDWEGKRERGIEEISLMIFIGSVTPLWRSVNWSGWLVGWLVY